MNTPIVDTAQAAQLLQAAQVSEKRGDRKSAHRFSAEATHLDPSNVDAWLLRARTASSKDEALFSLSRVHLLNPDHPAAKHESYRLRWKALEEDPFLGYLNETDDLYYVRSQDFTSLPIPKDRAVPEKYPRKEQGPLAPAFRMLIWATLGLLLAGLGTLVFAPLAMSFAFRSQGQLLTRPDKVRAWVAILLGAVLIVPALFLTWIFLSHLGG